MNQSDHASRRQQQRCIPPLIQELLADYGTRSYDNRGGVVCYFDRESRKRLRKNLGGQVVKRLGPMLNSYLVLTSDERRVITMGWRRKRIRR